MSPRSHPSKVNPWGKKIGRSLCIHRMAYTDLTQAAVADKMGIARSVASEIEAGLRLKPEIYIAYAHALGANLSIAFQGDTDGKPLIAFKLTKKEATP